MGKIALLTAALAVTVPSAVLLSACGDKEHTAAATWQSNEYMHWHACEANAQDNHSYGLAEHDWTIDGTRCSVCDYVRGSVEEVCIQTLKDFWEKETGGGSYTRQIYDPKDGKTRTVSYNYQWEAGEPVTEGVVWTRATVEGADGTTSYEDQIILKVYQNAAGEYIACEYNDQYDPNDTSADAQPQYFYNKVGRYYFDEHLRSWEYSDFREEYLDKFSYDMGKFNGVNLGQLFHGSAANFKQNAKEVFYDVFKMDVEVTIESKDGVFSVTIYEKRADETDPSSFVMTLENGVFSISMKEYSPYFIDGVRPLKNFMRQTTGYEPVAIEI